MVSFETDYKFTRDDGGDASDQRQAEELSSRSNAKQIQRSVTRTFNEALLNFKNGKYSKDHLSSVFQVHFTPSSTCRRVQAATPRARLVSSPWPIC